VAVPQDAVKGYKEKGPILKLEDEASVALRFGGQGPKIELSGMAVPRPLITSGRADVVKSCRSFPHGWLNRTEQLNKLHPIIRRWTTENTAIGRVTVVDHGIRKRTHDQFALSFGDHDLVFVVDRHSDLDLQPTRSVVGRYRRTTPKWGPSHLWRQLKSPTNGQSDAWLTGR
jgi:hypothetical protein